MNVIKKRDGDFTTVSNSFLRDERISFKAKGLFCYMFSMANGWNFTIQSISKQQFDGKASIASALDELKKYSFVSYTKHTDGTGTYYLDDEPKPENPDMGFPIMGKSDCIKKEQLSKKKKHIDELLLSSFREDPLNKEIKVSDETIIDFIKYRTSIKNAIKTIGPIKLYVKALNACVKNGYSKEEVIELMRGKEWASLNPEWVEKELGKRKYS